MSDRMAEPDGLLHGPKLWLAGLAVALANFMVVLDTTIANVLVPHIAGNLGVAPSQGIWVITSYAVAEAVCVPLTGWLTKRFGTIRVFVLGMVGFALFSMLCGLSTSLGMLIACRIGQGLCGGPIMPLSQTILLRIFPKRLHAQAIAIWAVTTIIGPILGPILGGTISDTWSWHGAFLINVPVAALCVLASIWLLREAETRTEKSRIDTVGLLLLVLWIAALQIMLDLGREHEWFADGFIVTLAIVAGIGFVTFVIWELTDSTPVVDLRVFRHRGFTASVLALSITFAAFFAGVVLLPQWLQGSMGYTATAAGYVAAWLGVSGLVAAPVVARLSERHDPRLLVCFGIFWLAATSILRSLVPSDVDFWTLSFIQFLQGFGIPFFFVPLTTLALGSVEPEETASAAGVMNFLRTMAGAIGASIVTTMWMDRTSAARSQLVGQMHSSDLVQQLGAKGLSLDQARAVVSQVVDKEAVTIATAGIFLLTGLIYIAAAGMVWLAPRPDRSVDTSLAH
jgi:DHA2 family multidrug resistance protein